MGFLEICVLNSGFKRNNTLKSVVNYSRRLSMHAFIIVLFLHTIQDLVGC